VTGPGAPGWVPTLVVVPRHGPGVGAGHLARDLALAQAWVAGGGRARIAADDPLPAGWAERYAAAGIEAVAVGEAGGDVAVLDGVAPRSVPAVPGRRVLVVDDHGRRPTLDDADGVLDANLGAEAAPRAPLRSGARALLGPRYALLRTDVVAARPASAPDRTAPPRRLLVALGGDPAPAVTALAEAVLARPEVAALGLEVVPLRGMSDVGAVLAGVDLALSAAGSTTWELCAHGVPAVLVAVADDQGPVARGAAAAGVAVDAGTLGAVTPDAVAAHLVALAVDPSRRAALAEAGHGLVDGHGARRVATALRASTLTLTPAGPGDAELVWRWANDPATREASFDSDPIEWEVHRRWFAARLDRGDAPLWIARDPEGQAVGQARLDPAPEGAVEIGLVVAPERRGQGWAAPLIAAAVERAFAGGPDLAAPPARITARVRPDNDRSARAFVAADFDPGPDGSEGPLRWRSYTRDRHG